MPEGQKSANIMVCSECGTTIATKESDEHLFDIFDCSWPCPNPECERLWLSSDGWEEVANLLIPYRWKPIGVKEAGETPREQFQGR